jgi:sugar phosphate isomerase/epimerase
MSIRDADIGLCPATLLTDPFSCDRTDLERVLAATTATGCRTWSLWVPLHTAAIGLDTAARLIRDAGVTVAVVEALTQWPDGPRAEAVAEAESTCAAAVALGASTVLACVLDPTLRSQEDAVAGFAAVCDIAAGHGLRVCLEFLPWTAIPNLAAAWDLVDRSGRPNAGLLLDTWHWTRQPGGPNPELLRQIPGERVHYVQVCDVAAEPSGETSFEAMTNRLIPGEGVADFTGLFAVLEEIGADPIVAAEVFNPALAAQGADVMAKAVYAATSAVVRGA